MDSDILAQAYAYLTKNLRAIRQITIVHRGHVVFQKENDEKQHRVVGTWSAAGTGGQKLLVIPELDLLLAAVAKTSLAREAFS